MRQHGELCRSCVGRGTAWGVHVRWAQNNNTTHRSIPLPLPRLLPRLTPIAHRHILTLSCALLQSALSKWHLPSMASAPRRWGHPSVRPKRPTGRRRRQWHPKHRAPCLTSRPPRAASKAPAKPTMRQAWLCDAPLAWTRRRMGCYPPAWRWCRVQELAAERTRPRRKRVLLGRDRQMLRRRTSPSSSATQDRKPATRAMSLGFVKYVRGAGRSTFLARLTNNRKTAGTRLPALLLDCESQTSRAAANVCVCVTRGWRTYSVVCGRVVGVVVEILRTILVGGPPCNLQPNIVCTSSQVCMFVVLRVYSKERELSYIV